MTTTKPPITEGSEPHQPGDVIGERLKRARLAAGYRSLKSLSDALAQANIEISVAALSNAETGNSRRPRHLAEIARILDVNVDWLTGTGRHALVERPEDEPAGYLRIPVIEERVCHIWLIKRMDEHANADALISRTITVDEARARSSFAISLTEYGARSLCSSYIDSRVQPRRDDLVVIDPEAPRVPGTLHAAMTPQGMAYGTYLESGSDGIGELRRINSDYADVPMDSNCFLVGRIVEIRLLSLS